MSDLVDWTKDVDDYCPLPQGRNPYEHIERPYHVTGQDFILVKAALCFISFDRVANTQLWNYVPTLAFRFEDKRIAWEYQRFLERHPAIIRPDLAIKIMPVASLPPYQVKPRSAHVSFYASQKEQEMDLRRWLTTYSGLT